MLRDISTAPTRSVRLRDRRTYPFPVHDRMEKPSMKYRPLIIAALVFLATGWHGLAEASFVLSFDSSSYTIRGSSTTVQVFLSQTPGIPQVGPGNELNSAAIRLSFNN